MVYNDFVVRRLESWKELNKGFSSQTAKKFLEEEFIPYLKEICEEAERTGKSLNEMVKGL